MEVPPLSEENLIFQKQYVDLISAALQTFSFVFGDGDPNQGIEEERWKLVILEHWVQWSVAFDI